MSTESLEDIETKIAFLERANADLSDVVFRQQQELQALRTQLAALCDRLDAAQSEGDVRSKREERPPHY